MEENINYQRIEEAIRFMTKNVTEQPDLDAVAKALHLSPFHFQRLFTEWVGITTAKYPWLFTHNYLFALTKINQKA